MSIKIIRRTGCGITWIRNALFYMAFPPEQFEFEIPSLSWMVYLYKDFELIEATDENGKPLDLTNIRTCCSDALSLKLKNLTVDDIVPIITVKADTDVNVNINVNVNENNEE